MSVLQLPVPLTACPWCGCTELQFARDKRRPTCFRVYCESCDIAGPRGQDQAEAVKHWDCRSQEPEDFVLRSGELFYAGDGAAPTGGVDGAYRLADLIIARWLASELNVVQADLHWTVMPVPLFAKPAATRAA